MAIDVYFREDISYILHAVNIASKSTAEIAQNNIIQSGIGSGAEQTTEHLDIYRRGYKDALHAVALALGITPDIYMIVTPQMTLKQAPDALVAKRD